MISNNNDNSIIKWHWSERKENSRAFKEWGKQVGSTQWLMVLFNARISPWSCGCPCPPHTPENHPDSQPRPTVRWTRSWWTDVRPGGFLRRLHPPHVGTRRRYPKSRGYISVRLVIIFTSAKVMFLALVSWLVDLLVGWFVGWLPGQLKKSIWDFHAQLICHDPDPGFILMIVSVFLISKGNVNVILLC